MISSDLRLKKLTEIGSSVSKYMCGCRLF